MAQAGVVMYGRTALLFRARVEGRKGGAVQSVTERCVATHGQRSSGGRGCRDAEMRRQRREKQSDGKNMRRGLCAAFDAVQSTAAKTPDYDTRNQYQKAPNSTTR
jgi:hypothetical protein